MRFWIFVVLLWVGCSDGEQLSTVPECVSEQADCDIGQLRCAGDTVEMCQPSSNACLKWESVATCAAGGCDEGQCIAVNCDPSRQESCNGRDDDCDGLIDEFVEGCAGGCQPECAREETRCDELGNIMVCTAREGCLVWGEPRGCPSGTVCIGQRCVEARDCHDMDADGVGVGEDCSVVDCDDRDPLQRPGAQEVCDGLDNDCNGVVDDSPGCQDCDEGVCTPGTMVCQGNDVVACVRGAEGCGVLDVLRRCEGPERCRDGACGFFECVDDRLEPNDTQEQARDVMNLEGISGQICAGGVDWFALGPAALGEWIEVTMKPVGPAGDLDLALWNSEGLQVTSAVAGADESVRWQAQAQAQVYVVVSGRDSAEGAYSLQWTRRGVRDCEDDAMEPNDAHIVAGALDGDSSFTATICPGDDDWYGPLLVEAGDTAMVQVNSENFLGSLEATLIDPVELEVLHRPVRGGEGMSLAFVAQEPTEVLLRVRATDLLGFGEYGVQVVLVGPDACVVDPAEPNDSFEQASPVSETGFICAADSDWYDLGGYPAGTLLNVAVEGTGFDPELELYAGDSLVAVSTLDDRREEIVWRVPRGQDQSHRVRVSAWGPWFGPYTIDVTAEVPPECQEDELEPNDSPAQATQLIVDVPQVAMLCGASEDWFELGYIEREESGDRLVVSAEHEGAQDDMVLRLYAGGVQVAQGADVRAGALIDLELPPGRRFYMAQIVGPRDVSLIYRMGWVLVGQAPCAEDEFEPNDTRDQAHGLQAQQTVQGHTCGNNPDWFVLNSEALEPGQIVRAQALFSHQDGDVDIRLYRGDQMVASGTSTSDNEEVSHVVPQGDALAYSIEVYGHGGAEAPYTVMFDIENPD